MGDLGPVRGKLEFRTVFVVVTACALIAGDEQRLCFRAFGVGAARAMAAFALHVDVTRAADARLESADTKAGRVTALTISVHVRAPFFERSPGVGMPTFEPGRKLFLMARRAGGAFCPRVVARMSVDCLRNKTCLDRV